MIINNYPGVLYGPHKKLIDKTVSREKGQMIRRRLLNTTHTEQRTFCLR